MAIDRQACKGVPNRSICGWARWVPLGSTCFGWVAGIVETSRSPAQGGACRGRTRHRLGVVCLVQAAALTDADSVDDYRAWRGQYREIFAGIILIGHQRGRLPGLVEGLAEETVPGGSRGLERGGRFESMCG